MRSRRRPFRPGTRAATRKGSREFGVSTVTVRGDLDALEAEGGIQRIHGGAMPVDATRLRERSFEEAAVEAAEAKARIAAAAADLLEPGMSVLLDVGTPPRRSPANWFGATNYAT